jgi:ABC-type antimicrobial peptide transport system permease subunit
LLLAGVLGLAAAAAVAHLLVTSVRRRRRDLAILKTLGFVRRQVSATVAWQATTVVVIALAVGLPLGIAAGRWTWTFFADQLGVVPVPVIALVSVLLAIPAVIVAGNLIAAVPGRLAARTRPAEILRSE